MLDYTYPTYLGHKGKGYCKSAVITIPTNFITIPTRVKQIRQGRGEIDYYQPSLKKVQ